MSSIKIDTEVLAEVEAVKIRALFASPAQFRIEQIIRSRLAAEIVEAGKATLAVGLGNEGSKALIDKHNKNAVKYANFLAVLDELKAEKRYELKTVKVI